MSIVVVVVAATVIGFLLILLAGSGKVLSPGASGSGQEGSADLAWVRDYGVEGFERMLLTLFSEMGFSAERSDRAQGTVDFYAVNPTPIHGGRIYVRGVFDNAVLVDAEEVLTLIDTARGEAVGKAVLVTLGRFSDEARDTAKDNPVDLLDGAALATLVKKHLPQAYATRTV